MGVEARFAAALLAALALSTVVGYVAASACATRNGYTEMGLVREVEDLRAATALLRYQAHVAESTANVHDAAAELGMRAADPIHDVDYVLLPHSSEEQEGTQLASRAEEGESLAAQLAERAVGVISVGGRAEASTATGDGQ